MCNVRVPNVESTGAALVETVQHPSIIPSLPLHTVSSVPQPSDLQLIQFLIMQAKLGMPYTVTNHDNINVQRLPRCLMMQQWCHAEVPNFDISPLGNISRYSVDQLLRQPPFRHMVTIPEAAPIKCAGRESAGRLTDSHIESAVKPTDSLTASVSKPADYRPSHFIGAASELRSTN